MNFSTVFAARAASLSARFCEACGTILDLPVGDGAVVCDRCGLSVSAEAMLRDSKPLVASSAAKLRPEEMGGTIDVSSDTGKSGGHARAEIDETCPKCRKVGAFFHTLQARSADEGETVFYECKACKHRWTANN